MNGSWSSLTLPSEDLSLIPPSYSSSRLSSTASYLAGWNSGWGSATWTRLVDLNGIIISGSDRGPVRFGMQKWNLLETEFGDDELEKVLGAVEANLPRMCDAHHVPCGGWRKILAGISLFGCSSTQRRTLDAPLTKESIILCGDRRGSIWSLTTQPLVSWDSHAPIWSRTVFWSKNNGPTLRIGYLTAWAA